MFKPFRLFDFNVITKRDKLDHLTTLDDAAVNNDSDGSDQSSDYHVESDIDVFVIQAFGMNTEGKALSLWITGFKPFFYAKVADNWNDDKMNGFLKDVSVKMGKKWEASLIHDECELVDKKNLYGFDGGRTHKFVKLVFSSLSAYNKAKNLWYDKYEEGKTRKLKRSGLQYMSCQTRLYEANIPPLLKFFHIKQLSPTGWIGLPNANVVEIVDDVTTCEFEYEINYKKILSLKDKEDPIPYKICSFDIEASSSHGDFPLPVKNYKKLATDVLEAIAEEPVVSDALLREVLLAAFGEESYEYDVPLVYPKIAKSIEQIRKNVDEILGKSFVPKTEAMQMTSVNKLDFRALHDEEDEQLDTRKKNVLSSSSTTISKFLTDTSVDRESKLNQLTKMLDESKLPALKGDEVTFIGSTFIKYGDTDPYTQNCIVVDTSDDINGVDIESYPTEKQALLAWTELIKREDPDIIIGYNIFGFDYKFMYLRARELNCVEEFLMLSKNKDDICGELDGNGMYQIKEGSIVLASGQYDLHYVETPGRVQIDMHNYFRRDYNLQSYKLDHVATNFIGDKVKKLDLCQDELTGNDIIKVTSKNLTGLSEGDFITFEEISHSSNMYMNGKKFKINRIDESRAWFVVDNPEFIASPPDMTKQVRWGMAKDDVTPQDIFNMTKQGPGPRSIIAKYCIQDCNLVHHLMRKIDVITGYVEMANICSVPMSFLVMRGQGIKLTSYMAKKCQEKNTLMPVIDKADGDDGYEGAIVLDPKTGLYDKPVACVDYSSLYPSSMISENISHDSKVWTKEYDLEGNLVRVDGERNKAGDFIYDTTEMRKQGYRYVDIQYDMYQYVRKTPKAAAVKVKCGLKICRYAQFPEGKGILPSILEELLAERKATRKLIPKQSDEFMKNVLDKRQLSIKVTANSLYGQTGAKTSTFYEKDVAASTTATGRKLLIYGKDVIEKVYADKICETDFGKVRTNAEYVYGDTDSVFFTFNLKELDGTPITGKKALEITIKLAIEAGGLATKFLKPPHDLEYEKTFLPFALLSKKRYVGMLYEEDPNVCYRKSMGIVLKRRDNADIVKDVYGGIIDILMEGEGKIPQAIDYLKNKLQNLIDENVPMEKLVITKSLRSDYKNPMQIAHKVLADRMGKRSPGNKPGPGDRIPFVYIATEGKKTLQGDRVEHPQYVVENKVKLDYAFYITNQIMKPVLQLFALVLEEIPDFKTKMLKARKFKREADEIRKTQTKEDAEKKVANLRNKEVEKLLFQPFIDKLTVKKNNQNTLFKYM
ncbi:MAG: DNA polymerase domain-containing protein [Candidatus Thorarchaeota archaeon]|jgi:DNA polymerase elongation subunit (family B)